MSPAQHQSDRGIVLVRRDVGEADRLLKVFTREHGAIWMRAKGVRRAGAKLAGGLEPLTESDYDYVAGRSVATIIGARIRTNFQPLLEYYDALVCAQALAEITDKCFPDNTAELIWYDWLIAAYQALMEHGSDSVVRQKIWTASLARHLAIAGLSPEIPRGTDEYGLDIQNGRFVRRGGEQISLDARKWWRLSLERDLDALLTIRGAEQASAELAPALERFWQYQTGAQDLSARMLS